MPARPGSPPARARERRFGLPSHGKGRARQREPPIWRGTPSKVVERKEAVKRYRNAPMDTKANSQGRRHAWIGTLAAALAIVSLPAAATIYKCQGANGVPVYQDEPCPPGKELRDFTKDPPTVSV